MADEAQNAGGDQANNTDNAAAEAAAAGNEASKGADDAGSKKEVTAGEALGKADSKKQPDKPAEPRMVPEAAFLELKSELKDLKRIMKDGSATKSEVNQTLQAIGDKYDIKPEFLQELSTAIRGETEAEFNKRLEKELEPYKATNAAAETARIDKVFNEHFDKTLEAMPEFKDVASRAVIKSLSLDPKNANKTFAKILEEAYGHLITGKRTIDGTKPRGGKEAAGIDYDRAKKDSEYFKEIMADPATKAEYNKNLATRLKL